MSRGEAAFVCTCCGSESLKWMGRCPQCGEWNSFQEKQKAAPGRRSGQPAAKPLSVAHVENAAEERTSSGLTELDRVLGGGIVNGSVTLIGGSPGIGKSTLLLQVSELVSRKKGAVLYVSGEESLSQLKYRADRLGVHSPDLFLFTQTEISAVCEQVEAMRPALAVVDSIQTMVDGDVEGTPGSVSQVRQCCERLMEVAKAINLPVFLVGHITKDGYIAGPKVLEHMVDAVLYFEGDTYYLYRVIRAVKNRFGPTNEIGVFEMRDCGLVEVPDPSMAFLAERPGEATGSQVVATIKGSRPVMLEIQSLVSESPFGNPRRLANGFDLNRLLLMLSVLEKKTGLYLGREDVHVNIVGGIKVEEPAVDLGLCISLASSFKNKPVHPGTFAFGEVGLAGEVRSVSLAEIRIKEGKKMGFSRCILPKRAQEELAGIEGVQLLGVNFLGEALENALE